MTRTRKTDDFDGAKALAVVQEPGVAAGAGLM
jgi:hypothetical protein